MRGASSKEKSSGVLSQRQQRNILRNDAHIAAEQRAIAAGDVPLRNRLLGIFHVKIAEYAGNEVLAQI